MLAIETPKVRKHATATPRLAAPRILVATAGDADSVGALHFAAELAQQRAATVMALGVATPFPHNVTTLVSLESPVSMDEDARRRVLAHIRQRVRHLPGADQWFKRAEIGWPADVINDSAAAWNASMIVLGIGRHGRMDRLFRTETAVAVIKRASVPVLAVSTKTRWLPRHACAAVDFTKASLASAVLAASLLANDGTLTLVHTCAFKGVTSHAGDLVDIYRTGARTKLEEAVAEVHRRTKIHVEGVMLEGDPGQTILRFARQNHCDLISVGGHEQGLMDRILLGSVRTRVLRGAKCSVLIAPPAGEE